MPELLAVIAVILILISLLLPNLGVARERAREAICRSNLHQIFIGSRSYSNDSWYMPTGWDPPTGTVTWVTEIYPYIPNANVFYCPSAPPEARWSPRFGSGLPPLFGTLQDQYRIGIGENFSYGHNNGGSTDSSVPSLGVGDTTSQGWNRVAKVRSASNFIMYGDSTVDGLWDHFIDEDVIHASGQNEFPADRHYGGAHIAFGDGHVEHIPQKYLIFLGSEGTAIPELRRRWNNDNEPH